MMTFFRRIRERLIASGSIPKYLLYAMGEILLVVVGILIALQVNNWNEGTKERHVEQQLLEQIHKDLTGGLNDINNNINQWDQSIASADVVIEHMDSNKAYHDSIAVHMSYLFTWSRLVIDLGGYESMKSEGIDIISNVELKNRIINLFEGQLYFLRELEELVGGRTEQFVNKEGAKYFKSMNEGFGMQNGELNDGRSEPLDYDKLRIDPTFRFHVLTMKSMINGFQDLSNLPSKHRIENLIIDIETELETF